MVPRKLEVMSASQSTSPSHRAIQLLRDHVFTSRFDVILIITELLLVLGICTILYRLVLHPLRKIPGPRIAAITGLWRSARYMKGKWHEDILELHQKYGRVVRIAPNELSIVDENAMKSLYGHGHNAPKTDWYATWDPPSAGPGFFAARDKKLHAFLRKRVSAAYSMTGILKFEVYIQDCLNLMLEKLSIYADAGQVVNMSDWSNALAFDVVGELAFGQQLGHLRTETDVMSVRKNVLVGFQIMSTLGHFPLQSRLLNNPYVAGFSQLCGVPDVFSDFMKWSTERVTARMSESEKRVDRRDDMLAHFCRMKRGDGSPAQLGDVLIESMNIIGAGADTTSIGMRACLFYICSRPDVYRRLQSEVDAFYDENKLTSPITYLQTQQLPYLAAVVSEATRLFPSIVFQLLRHAPPGLEVDGYEIPPNTPVGISPIAQNRDKAIWGTDAEEFKPERWLESAERTRYLESCNFTFGGSGPRMCVGRNIALVEMHKFIAQFVRHFEFDIVDKQRPWEVKSYWFAYQHEFRMRLQRRRVENQ